MITNNEGISKIARFNRFIAIILMFSLIFLGGLPGAAFAQEQGTTRAQIDQVITDLVQWEEAYLEKAFAEQSPENIVEPTVYNWPTLGLARLGYYDGLEKYLTETENYAAQNWQSISRKVTDLERIALAIGAAQGDPRNFAGKDLIAEIYNFPNIQAQGLNGPIFALLALDSGNYVVAAEAKWSREDLLKIILSKQLPDGGFNLRSTGSSDPDITAMALQALAPYYREGRAEVRTVVDEALATLSKLQDQDGHYISWGAVNSESTAQVIIALCSLGIDPDTDPRFIKNGRTLPVNLLQFRAEDGGFKHVLDQGTDAMASEQALIALASYVRFKDGKTSLYDYSDIVGNQSEPGNRLAGADRYETAWEIVRGSFPDGAETVLLTGGELAADALAAVPLAHKHQAPILLTPSQKLPDKILTGIQNLKAKNVLIIGGEGVVAKEIEGELKAKGLKVERLAGKDRYETAYLIAKSLNNQGKAVLIKGNTEVSFPDALSISPWAGYQGVPILFLDGAGNLPEATAKAIQELNVEETFLVGEEGALPASLESLLPGVQRYSGKDIYETNRQVLNRLQPQPTKIYLATGSNFADALAGGAVAAQANSWILLTDQEGLSAEQKEMLEGVKDTVTELYVLGGEGAVSGRILRDALEVLGK
ncbi:cell wall-binding protein [Desulfitobacterium hafniense]|uniref:Cell wall-binding protein n=1 Tax=Desulfitobacterium hafniense TaxID=49338 RepID=A0A0W1JDE9_DESHA|nr:cell wall-binding repeat-containing protein [Desulfitobacterium hafniense]KTE89384.1 cell wall-binding protein [Desulfitobacterium hafniense]